MLSRGHYGHTTGLQSLICGSWPRVLCVLGGGRLPAVRCFAADGRLIFLGEGLLIRCTMCYSHCTYYSTYVCTRVPVLFNHRTWMVCDWLFVRIPVESNEITLAMTSQYWSFHVVATVIQYFRKVVTYSERYSICTVRYTIFNPQHSKKFAPCTFLLERPAQHVPAVLTESVEWCAPAVLRLAWCKTFSHRVDRSKPARLFIVSSFSMLQANSVSKFLLWANFLANSCSEQIWFLWAVFLYCEQFFCTVSKFSLLWAICVQIEIVSLVNT